MGRRARRLALTGLATATAVGVAAVLVARRGPVGPLRALSSTGRAARSAQIAGLTARVGTATALSKARATFASAERRIELDQQLQLRTAEEVTATLGQMKGAMMKLGQLASFIDEGLPEPLRQALTALQADAPPMAPELAAKVVTEELGAPPGEVFLEWEAEPIAAASIGQVHKAITHDGQAVAVKVQYPGAAEAIAADLANADLVFGSLALVYPGFDPAPVVAELKERITEELDYRNEATNQQLFADAYRGHPFISVPEVRMDLSTSRVLVTDLHTGATLDEVDGWDQAEKDLAGEAIYRFVFRSLYRLGAFNGDPHPGNYLFRPGGHVSFLDFGLVRHFDGDELGLFRAMITSMVVDHDPEAFRRAVVDAGLLAADAPVTTDEVAAFFEQFYRLVQEAGPRAASPEYASSLVRRTFNRESPVTRYTTVPASFVLIQRINMGVFAILGRLRATADWRRITEEIWPWTDAPPSTPLGRAEADWLATRS